MSTSKNFGFAKMTRAQTLKILRALKTAADHAEADFFRALIECERDARAIWETDKTFPGFLARTKLCAPERYARAKCALTEIEPSTVAAIGIGAASEAIRLSKPSQRRELLKELLGAATEHGTTVSSRYARNLVNEIIPPSRDPSEQTRKIEALQHEVSRLNGIIARYRERYGELGPETSTKKTSARKAPRKGAEPRVS